jgi:hypothetical protein
MSKLGKLVGEGKEVKIGEITLDIKPLTVSSLPLLMQIGDEKNKEAQANAMKEVIVKTLKDSVPDATEEEIERISLEHMTKLMEAIMDVNQLEMDEEKKEFIERMKNVGHAKTDGA